MSTIDAQLRLLLLRRLPAEEAQRLEDAILLEDGFAERLRDEEFDLLDDYAASRLSAEDAADVERHLLVSQEDRQALRVARALRKLSALRSQEAAHEATHEAAPQSAASPLPRRRQTTSVWRVAALLAACLAIVVYIPRWSASQHPQSVDRASTTAELPIVSLLADVSRGPQSSASIHAGTSAIRLQVEVPDPTPGGHYSLVIEDPSGLQLFVAPALEARSAGRYQFVETVVPTRALGQGERTIALIDSGTAPDAHTGNKFTWRVNSVIP